MPDRAWGRAALLRQQMRNDICGTVVVPQMFFIYLPDSSF